MKAIKSSSYQVPPMYTLIHSFSSTSERVQGICLSSQILYTEL